MSVYSKVRKHPLPVYANKDFNAGFKEGFKLAMSLVRQEEDERRENKKKKDKKRLG
jgi:hypothetical protein